MNMSPEAVAARERLAEARKAKKYTPVKEKRNEALISDEEMVAAIDHYRGHVSNAAKHLGIHPVTFRKKVRDNPALQERITAIRDELIDKAEHTLWDLVEQKNLGAVIFVLKTVGRHRGYQENTKLEHELAHAGSAAGLISVFRKEIEEPDADTEGRLLETSEEEIEDVTF